MRKILFFLGLCCQAFMAAAQIDVVDNQTAQSLAQSLVGQGVIMLNPVLNCPGVANGKFAVIGTSNLGIDSGIVLTSGRAMTVGTLQGVNGPSINAGPTLNNGGPGDPQLNTVLNGLLSADRCALEFDFVPTGDTIKFDYAFGSSEYASYSCSNYNDIFGFFISGPGYTGPTNIALIPGTNIPICVNSTTGVLSGSLCTSMGPGSPFSQYYINNAGGTSITYRGFTTVFTAVANVIPCDTFHLKLAIADGSSSGTDRILDSGVFLKAGSLNSNNITLASESSQGGNDTLAHCIRGCKSGFVKFSRSVARPTPLTIKYQIGGTAVNGMDYQWIPDSIVIQANQTSADLEIKPLLVQYPNPVESVIIRALSPYTCSNGQANILDTAVIYIHDSLYVAIPTLPVTVCPMTEVPITALIDPTLTYTWSPAAFIPDPLPLGLTIHPKPEITRTFTITVGQPGAPATCPPVSRSYTVQVEPIPQIVMPSHDTVICYADSIDLDVYALPAGINYTYLWSPPAYLRDNYSPNNKLFAPPGDYQYTVTATTPVAHCQNKDSMLVHVFMPFTFDWVTQDTIVNYGDRIQLNSESEAIMWLWDPVTYLDDPLAKTPNATPLEPITYTLVGIDANGCKDTATVSIKIKHEPKVGMPNAFSPNGDGLNDVFRIANVKYEKLNSFQVFNRWGAEVFNTGDINKGWDGLINGKPAAADTYYYLVVVVLSDGSRKTMKGDVTLIR